MSVIFVSMMCTAKSAAPEEVVSHDFPSFVLMVGAILVIGILIGFVLGVCVGMWLSRWIPVQPRRSSSTQTNLLQLGLAPMPEYWLWSAVELKNECQKQNVYAIGLGQPKAAMINGLVKRHGDLQQ